MNRINNVGGNVCSFVPNAALMSLVSGMKAEGDMSQYHATGRAWIYQRRTALPSVGC